MDLREAKNWEELLERGRADDLLFKKWLFPCAWGNNKLSTKGEIMEWNCNKSTMGRISISSFANSQAVWLTAFYSTLMGNLINVRLQEK